MAFLCKACGSQGPHPVHVFREMMFGTREKFEYIECNDCGSIQRLTEVSDESRFYPNNYYSFSHIRPSLRSRISVLRDSHALGVTTRRLLSSTGRCLIRIPTCSSFAWRHDGSNWVQLDAPRHVVIFSRDGLSKLAARVGFHLDATIDDSWEFQFTGSDRYCRDIPLCEPRDDLFTRRELRAFRERALKLNFRGQGDQAPFILSPPIG
jgi:hypothetical protein